MCWLCRCKPTEWRHWGPRERRAASLSKAEFLAGVSERGKVSAAIFQLPGVTNHALQPDWMHSVDGGFAALVCGQVLHALLPAFATRQREQVQGLWDLLQRLYDEHKVPKQQRLAKLTYLDIKKKNAAAELSGKALLSTHAAEPV